MQDMHMQGAHETFYLNAKANAKGKFRRIERMLHTASGPPQAVTSN